MLKALVDMDGVCTDLLGRIEMIYPSFRKENVETYDFHGDIGVERSLIFDLFKKEWFFNGMQYYPGVESACKKLESVCDAYVYTTVPNNEAIVDIRSQQARALGLDGDVFVADKPVLKGYTVLFEDCIDNINQYLSSKDDSTFIYLIDHTYNKGISDERVVRMLDFSSAVDDFVERVNSGYFT